MKCIICIISKYVYLKAAEGGDNRATTQSEQLHLLATEHHVVMPPV